MHRVLLDMGPLTIYSYGAMIGLGFLIIIYGMGKLSPQIGVKSDCIIDLVMGAAAGGVIGSRIYYVLAYDFSYYMENPIQIFNIRQGGLVYFGGLMGGTMVVIAIILHRKWPLWEIADLAGIFIPLGYTFGRVGCFLNGCCYGIETNSILGVSFKEVGRGSFHPTMIYLAMISLSLFVFGLWYRKRRKFAGEAFLLYLFFYSIGRFLVEFLRVNPMIFGFLTVAQVTAIVTMGITGALYPILKGKNAYKNKDDNSEDEIKTA